MRADLAGIEWAAIVVDNASTDGSADQIAPDAADRPLVIRNAVNRGFGAAVNQAVERAPAAPLLWLLNPDCRVTPGTFERLRAILERHADCAIAAPRLLNSDGTTQESARGEPTAWTGLLGRHGFLTRWFPGAAARRNLRAQALVDSGVESADIDWVMGACMLIRRPVFEAVGGFDERFFLYWEDADLCHRIRALGHTVRYVPGARVEHPGGASSRTASRLAERAFHRSAYVYYTTHTVRSRWNPARGLAWIALTLRAWWRTRGPAEAGHHDPLRLAAGAALRFTRQHGLYRAARLAVAGLVTLGPRGLIRRAAADRRQQEDDDRYASWLAAHPLTRDDLTRLRSEVSALPLQPAISIVTTVFNTNPNWLRRCVESVRSQVYTNWELCLCDDGSTRLETVKVLEEWAADPRIRIERSAVNGGMVAASNAALQLATGDFVGFLDHDDELAPDALAEVVRRINADPAVDVVYTDEDKIDEAGVRGQPHFKPDWSPELLRSCMYISHFTVMRRSLVDLCGRFRAGTDGAQDYDLMLRAVERTSHIAHIPRTLYHWRMTSESAASSQLGKRWAVDAGRRVLDDHLQRVGLDAQVVPAEAAGHYRARHALKGTPLVSLLLCGGTSKASSDTAFATTYGRVERVVVNGRDAGALDAAARSTAGEHLVVVGGVLEPQTPDWLEALLEFSQQPEIGAVGPLLLAPDGRIHSAGLVLGAEGRPLPAFQGEPAWTRGHLSNILDVRNCSALDGAIFMTRRAAWDRTGGFDAGPGGEISTVEYCRRLAQAGLRTVVTPYAKLRLRSPAVPERALAAAGTDPYYNPNFDQRAATFRLPVS